jgi:hypothetical protein
VLTISTATRFVDIGHFARLIFSAQGKGSFAVIVKFPVIECFLDESSDQERQDVFCVGGFIANEVYWRAMQKEWVERLAKDGVAYFRASDCKSLSGPFRVLTRKYGSVAKARPIAEKLRRDLEQIIAPYHWIGFAVCVPMSEYTEVFHVSPAARLLYPEGDPTEPAYAKLMYQIARLTRKNAPLTEIAYVIDEARFSGKIVDVFKATKQNHPIIGKVMRSILPLDDKVTPALQIADLIASVVKDAILERLKTGEPLKLPYPWKGHFSEEGLFLLDQKSILCDIKATLKSKRYYKGKLAKRAVIPLSKSEKKRRHKVAILKRGFDKIFNPKRDDQK